MSAEVDTSSHASENAIEGKNNLLIDFTTTTTTNSKASIPTGKGMEAFAHLSRQASDVKKTDSNSSDGGSNDSGDAPFPNAPKGSADGNL